MNKKVILGLAFLTASTFADDIDSDLIAKGARTMGQSASMAQQQQMQPSPLVTLTPASVKSEYGYYFVSEALYWHAALDTTDFGWKNNAVGNGATSLTGPNHEIDFKWGWGLRVGGGMKLDCHDSWDSNIFFTWFNTKNSNTLGTNSSQMGIEFDQHRDVTQIKADRAIRYQMYDWTLGRWYSHSAYLAMRPFFGVRGGTIHQNHHKHVQLNAAEFPGQTATQHQENHFWGVGISGGVNSKWLLCNFSGNHVSLLANFAGALMYGRFNIDHVDRTFTNGAQTAYFHPNHLNRHLAVPMLAAGLKLGWDTGFSQDQFHLAINFGYEFEYWFRQLQSLSQINLTPNGATPAVAMATYSRNTSDLSFQGMTLDVRFDF